MMDEQRIQKYLNTLQEDARQSGYQLNPDADFLRDLAVGLLTNTDRYGYQACPCRRAEGVMEQDLDIICPCDYRDEDLEDYGACYCALYVNEAIATGQKEATAIPDRRKEELGKKTENKKVVSHPSGASYPVWRCSVCGYLCARNSPPEKCPICKVQKERFELFTLN